MTGEHLRRRLAAILSADIVGYSRLMGLDEAGTLLRLNALRRELIDPTITAHSGRIVKLIGDGAPVEFARAVDAVTCAMEIQKRLPEQVKECTRMRHHTAATKHCHRRLSEASGYQSR
jgi:adenylate cyclase